MLDRLYLPMLTLAAGAAIALAMVWPQGLGDRSPAPFGSIPVQRTPAMQAAMKAEAAAAALHVSQTRDQVRALQSQALAPEQ
jgi:hypothetical protein